MPPAPEPTSAATRLRDLSPIAGATAVWLRQLARALRTMRLYRTRNTVSDQLRDAVADTLERLVLDHGAVELRITATEMLLDGEAVVRPTGDHGGITDPVETLPFLFYRDGIRRIRFGRDLTRVEVDALLDALAAVTAGPNAHDDLVTLLWQGNLTNIQIETVPLEQTIYLAAYRPTGGGGTDVRGQAYLMHPGGADIRADLGQVAGPQGLHRDTFDDWPLPEQVPDAVDSWSRTFVAMQNSLELYRDRCRAELERPWTDDVEPLLGHLLELDPTRAMRLSLVRSVVSWVASSLQRCAWDEAQLALEHLRRLDPDASLTGEDLEQAVAGLDHQTVTERLDAADDLEHSRFAAIVVAIGKPALDLATAVMARSQKVRVRASACTALTYLCGDDPHLLDRYVSDTRWEIVRNTVFVLGQIGGEEVVPLLRRAAANPEPRVRRMVVQAAGNVPREYRIPILVAQLDSRDPQVLAAALNMLTREKSAKVARAILDHIESPDFETRREDNQRALFAALGDVADDSVVGPLDQLLNKGGWFARRTLERVAAARTLRRIGTEKAMAVLDAGLRSRVEAVRSACLDAMSTRLAS